LNQLCRNSSNDIILNYDVDAIIPYSQIKDAITMIKNGADMVYPYSGLFLNVTRETIQQLIISKFNFSMLNETNTQWWNDKAIGGAMMWNKKSYMDSGMENENFKGWGFEDDERVTRSRILGLTIQRTTGPLYHIDHSRTSPNYNQTQLTQNNQRLLNGIARMNRQQLLEEIKKWKWL
jgi:predicted glycosyltransferase involved in capsule biosynthesis